MIFTTVAAGTNRLHRVTCAHRSIQFDDRPAVPWPTMGMFPKAAAGDLGVLVAAKGAEGYSGDLLVGGQLIVGNDRGAWQVLSPTIGKACVGVETDGADRFRVAAIVSATRWAVWSVSYDLSEIRLVSAIDDPKCATQDWLDFQNGVPTWTVDQPFVTLHGVRLWSATRRGRWTVGLSERAFGVDAYDHETGRLCRVWDGDTPYPPVIASLPDGSAVVAISADVPAFIPSSQFDPMWSAPLVVPEFPSAAIACVPFDWYEVDPRVPRIVGYRPGEDASEGDIRYVLCTVGRDSIEGANVHARKVGAQSLGYLDEHAFDPSRIPAAADVMGLMCYPKGTTSDDTLEPFAQARTRILGNIARAAASRRPFAFVIPVYSGSREWPVSYVLNLDAFLWETASRLGVDVIPFGIDRAPKEPEFTTVLTRMIAAAKGRQPQPVPVQPAPAPIQPVPSPVVTEDADDMPRPPLDPQQKEDAIKDLGPIVAAYHQISLGEGEQGIREAIDAYPTGSGAEWMTLAGARAHGATTVQREVAARRLEGLRRG